MKSFLLEAVVPWLAAIVIAYVLYAAILMFNPIAVALVTTFGVSVGLWLYNRKGTR